MIVEGTKDYVLPRREVIDNLAPPSVIKSRAMALITSLGEPLSEIRHLRLAAWPEQLELLMNQADRIRIKADIAPRRAQP